METAGYLLMSVGAVHLLLATAGVRSIWAKIARSGWWDTLTVAPAEPEHFERHAGFWATAGSFAAPAMLLGGTVVWAGREGLAAPAWLGWGLLAWTLLCASVAPRGGFWAFLAPAILLIVAGS